MNAPQEIKLKKHFSIKELLARGWRITIDNLWLLVGLQVALFALFLLASVLINFAFPADENASVFSQLMNSLLGNIMGVFAGLGFTNYALRLSDYKSINFQDFFAKSHLFLKYFIAELLYVICAAIGFLCLIIPGFIIITRFSLFGYFIVDKELGPIEALERSWKTVRGASWGVFGFLLVSFLVLLVGLLCLGAGLLIAFPTVTIATAFLYRTLLNQTDLTVLADK